MAQIENRNSNRTFYGSGSDPEIFNDYLFRDHYPTFQIIAASIKNYFHPKKILDVGCAKGFLVKAFNEIGKEAWGVDVSEYAISNAPEDIKSRLFKANLNCDRLPFEEGHFDFITFIGTANYLTNHKHAINEIKGVLLNNGYISKTLIKKIDKEKVESINIHEKEYWIKEFESHGFRYVKKELTDFIINEFLEQMFEIQNRKGDIPKWWLHRKKDCLLDT